MGKVKTRSKHIPHLLVVLCGSILLLVARGVLAQPKMEVHGESTCPTPEQMEPRMSDWADLVPSGDSWRVEIGRRQGTPEVSLRNPAGARVLRRSIDSDDCEALAGAFAAIVQAYLIDLGVVSTGEKELEPETPALRDEPIGARPKEPVPRPKRAWVLSSGAAGGPMVSWPGGPTTGAGQLRSSIGPALGLWRMGVVAGAALPADHEATSSRVERMQMWAQAEVGLRMGNVWWTQPGFSAGIVRSRVRAVDIRGETQGHTTGALGLCIVGGLRLGGGWSLTGELSQRILWVRNRYIIEPDGAVGYGPRGVGQILVGAQLDVML